MVRRILGVILVVLSAIFLLASLVGVGAVWFYNEPLTREVTTQLKQVDSELAQAEATLASSEEELERALRIVTSAQEAMEKLTEQSEGAGTLLENIQATLDDRLLPELHTTRDRLETARTTLENLQGVLAGIRNFIPGLDLSLPDSVLNDLIGSTRSLDTEIKNVEGIVLQASLFVSDSSFLLGGDLTQTQESLESFLSAIQDYEKKVAGWRAEEQRILSEAPRWIDQASIGLTVFLLWFALSQYSLLLHGLAIQRGDPAFLVIRQPRHHNPLIKDERDLEMEE